ncbi:YfkD-like protein [Amphibacillus marinus]|uniref:YfkD-like protein n=1 Tax=Amphibacillus marinus TaxID=872970 RepID=A0A1H8RG09_9BACI|nr:YfkD family protein [Amphibacillus marinus]SEO65272.1 YfkD-like protein [Amphibacillus marinus]
MKRLLVPLLFFGFPIQVVAVSEELLIDPDQLPAHVQSIEQENTRVQEHAQAVFGEAKSLTKTMLEKQAQQISNPFFIEQLNETQVNNSKFAFGYKSEVYLGRWPLHYESKETGINWSYQKVNENYVSPERIKYFQTDEVKVNGGIQSKIPGSEQIQQMVLQNVMERLSIPVSFEASFGADTEKVLALNNNAGRETLEAYAGAVKEVGQVTYGEVFLTMNGRKQDLTIKNVVDEEITVWLPIPNRLAFHFK